MKQCASCNQIVAQRIIRCPACGSLLMAGMTHIDDYRIQAIIHEGRSSLVCRAVKKNEKKPVSIRVFTDQSGVDQTIARRLENELQELNKLPKEHFVQHYSIKQSSTGHWYRVSEWVDAHDWGAIFVSGLLRDQRRMTKLFYDIAAALDILHKHDHFMPYLILEDILIPKNKTRSKNIKINYKLSRFLNARATHHGPMLQKLLECHPDIVNKRAIDFRTGIWSLGKIYVELLTAEHNLTDFSSKVDQIKGLDPKLAILIKIMLSDDPDLRPQTMTRVVSALSGILDTMPHKDLYPPGYKPGIPRQLNWFKGVTIMFMVILGIIIVSMISWFYLNQNQGQKKNLFPGFVESYSNSIGFIIVEYWLKNSNQVVYKNRVEGTAFLVDQEGYLLTNRHVACPWLDDPTLFRVYNQYRLIEKNLEFDQRMFLWFEGQKAFNRLPGLRNSLELSDTYYLASAFRSDQKANLRIVGVPMMSGKTGEMINSPFRNDFAVLKIDTIPQGLTPLPLEFDLDASRLQRLSPVIILGFPLGSKTQDDTINASVTRGHIRRTSKEIIQVDSSIYRGNSGGPAVNAKGLVIGIASGVVTEQAMGYVPMNTPLSDFGLVLPISLPAKFLKNMKAGQPKWNGLLDFTLETKLKQITQVALEHKYAEAAALADKMLETGNDPVLLFTSGILNFCSRNFGKSRQMFKRLISFEGENTRSRLLLYIIDWLLDQEESREQTKDLFTMNWQDREEFSAYLAKVLKKGQKIDPELLDFENRQEKAWRFFVQGLVLEKEKKMDQAMEYFKRSILNADAIDYLYFMAFSRLNGIQKGQSTFAIDAKADAAENILFRQRAKKNREQSITDHTAIVSLMDKFESHETGYEKKIKIYASIMELRPENRTMTGRMAFFYAMNSEWQSAVDLIDTFFTRPTRETSLSLSLGLLKGQIIKITQNPGQAKKQLGKFKEQTRDPWYSIISKHLILGTPESEPIKIAGKDPEKLITLQTALGLWAEGDNDKEKAAHHYREALGTYLDGWNEYDLALNRIKRFRQNLD